MKTFKDYLMEVQQPLSQGEKNFYAMHKPETKSYVPGVTDQDHVFKGNERRKDPKTASYEIEKSEDQSVAAYDKNLKVHENPSVQKEDAALAALAPPKDKVTKKDVLVGRGVLKKHPNDPNKHVVAKEEVELDEKTLTPAELKKREEVAKAIARENPGMDKSKKMAIATATAKRVAEEAEQVEEGKYNWDKEHKRGLTDTQGNRMLKKKPLPSAGASKDELRALAAKATKVGKVIEAVLSAKQKKIASLKEPKDEIDADDLAALRRGEHKK